MKNNDVTTANFLFWFTLLTCTYKIQNCNRMYNIEGTGKDKAIPLQAWTGPEGSRRLRLPDFKTVGIRRW